MRWCAGCAVMITLRWHADWFSVITFFYRFCDRQVLATLRCAGCVVRTALRWNADWCFAFTFFWIFCSWWVLAIPTYFTKLSCTTRTICWKLHVCPLTFNANQLPMFFNCHLKWFIFGIVPMHVRSDPTIKCHGNIIKNKPTRVLKMTLLWMIIRNNQLMMMMMQAQPLLIACCLLMMMDRIRIIHLKALNLQVIIMQKAKKRTY